MAAKKNKRPSSRPRRTAIVPRVVFSTLVAVSVVPAASVLAGCGQARGPEDSGAFSVALPRDAGRDVGTFSVALPIDAGHDSAFSVVAMPIDAGTDTNPTFSVAAPLDGAFSVIIAPSDASS